MSSTTTERTNKSGSGNQVKGKPHAPQKDAAALKAGGGKKNASPEAGTQAQKIATTPAKPASFRAGEKKGVEVAPAHQGRELDPKKNKEIPGHTGKEFDPKRQVEMDAETPRDAMPKAPGTASGAPSQTKAKQGLSKADKKEEPKRPNLGRTTPRETNQPDLH